MPTKKGSKSKAKEPQASLFNYLKFGESYTSLILGIVVVIISTVLLLSFVHNKNVNRPNANQEITNTAMAISPTPTESITATLTKVISPTATLTPTPTNKPTATATVTPKPTEKKITPTAVTSKKKVTPTASATPTTQLKQEKVVKGGTYTIVAGDTLWKIAEKIYNDGYKWTEIARVNNLSNPSLIHVGNKLTLPRIEQKNTANKKVEEKKPAKQAQVSKQIVVKTDKITGGSYKIKSGDSLWSISVRAYGDGYKWTDIAKANKLSNGGVIHVGNTIKIPRGK